MALFLRDGIWQDTSTDTVDHGGSGWIDEAGQVFNAQGEYVPGTGNTSVTMIGGAAVNDPNRSFAPDILVNGRPAADTFYEAKGQFAPSAEQMAQTYNPALGGDFFSQNATPADTGQGLSGIAGFLRANGWLVPLALASGGLALEAAGGLGAASAGIGAGTEGAAYTGAAAGGLGASSAAPVAAGIGTISPTATLGIGGTGGAANLSGMAAAQSALGLGSAPTGLLASSVGIGGTAGAGSLAGITGSALAAGLGGTALGTGLTAAQLASYDAAAGTTTGNTMEELLTQIGDQAGDYPMPGESGTASQWVPSNINPTDVTSLLDYNAAYGLTDTSTLMNLIKQYGPTVAKTLLGSFAQATGKTAGGAGATGLGSGLLGAAGNYALSQYQLGQLSNVYNQNVAGQQAATQTAQQQASFKPVGITTAFGQSNFQYDPATGQMTAAGYSPTSQVSGQVQNLMGLGAQALPTTANTQDIQNQYIAQQQGLLAPGREQQLAGINNQQWQTGRTGLATGGTTAGYAAGQPGLMQTNPELAAYYNSIGQQNAQIASNAPTYAQNLLNSQIATGTGLFGAANTLEGYAQAPLALSSGLGTAASTAGAKAGYYGLLGNQAALQTQLQGQQANIYGQGQALTSASQPLLSAGNNLISNWF